MPMRQSTCTTTESNRTSTAQSRSRRAVYISVLGAAAITLAACSSSTSSGTTTSSGNTQQTTATTSASASLSSLEAKAPTSSTSLLETGSSLLYPLFNLWVAGAKAKFPNLTITTASTGSGTGVSAAATGTVQIGASDAYLSPTQVSQYSGPHEHPASDLVSVRRVQRAGCQRKPEADRTSPVRHLPGPGDQLGRFADKDAESRGDASEPAYRHGAPFGQLGRHFLLHVVPLGHRSERMGSQVQLQHVDPIPQCSGRGGCREELGDALNLRSRPGAASPTSGSATCRRRFRPGSAKPNSRTSQATSSCRQRLR